MADVQLIGPDGTPETVPAEQAQTMVALGYQVATPELLAEQARMQELGGVGGEIKAGLAGAARGLTGGLSDVALTKGGIAKPETLRALKEANPTISTASEIGGALLPVAGELGLGARAGEAAAGAVGASEGLGGAVGGVADAALVNSPAGMIQGAGKAVEDLAREHISNEIAARIAGATARGTLESQLYNMGNNVSEAALGDEDLTAQKLLAHSGDALAVGAGLGFGISAGGAAAKAAAGKARDVLGNLDSVIKDKLPFADESTLNDFAEKQAAANQAARAAGDTTVTMTDPAEIKALYSNPATPEGQAYRASLGTKDFRTPEERDQTNKAFGASLTDAVKGVRSAKREAFNVFRPKEIGNLVKDVDPELVTKSAFDLSDSLRGTIKQLEADPDIYSSRGQIAALKRVADGYDKRLLAVKTPEEIFNLVNDTKRTLGEQTRIWDRDPNVASRATNDAIKMGPASAFKSALENQDLWGEAAARQAAFNSAYARLASAEEELLGKGKRGAGAFGKGGQVNSKKVNTFLSQTGAARSEYATAALKEYQSAAADFLQQVENSSVHAGVPYDKAGVTSLIEKSQKISVDAEKKLALESKVRQSARLDDIGYNMTPGTAGAAMKQVAGAVPGGNAVMGAVGAVGGTARAVQGLAQTAGGEVTAKSTAELVNMAKTLGRVEGFALGTSKKIAKALDSFASSGDDIGRSARRALTPAAAPIGSPAITREDRLEEFGDTKRKLAAQTANSATQLTDLAGGLQRLQDHAPNTTQAVIKKQMQVAQFLQSKIPHDPYAADSLSPTHSTWVPSTSELAKFDRYQRAATQPTSVFEDAAKGIVTPEGVEAVRALYPGLLDEFKAQLMDKASDGARYDRQKLTALSQLLGTPLTPLMRPELLSKLQGNFTPSKDTKDSGPDMPKPASNGKTKFGSSLATAESARQESK